MCSCNQSQAVIVVKCLRNILPERVSCATGRDTPTASVIGITPEQIAHGSFMGNFLDTIKRTDVIKGIDGRTEASVKAENLVINKSGEGKVVEKVGEIFPDIGIAVFTQALVVEAIHLCDLAGLMVTTKDSDALGVADLESNKERHCLDGVIATVDIIT